MTARVSSNRLLYTAAVVSALGGFLFGYDTGVISGALLYITRDFALSSFAQESVVSALLVGAAIGAVVAGRLTDVLGRRRLIIVTSGVFVVGVVLAAIAPGTLFLVGARFVIGLAVGAASFSVPLYISEIAPPEKRGMMVSLNQLMITIGIVVSYLVDLAFSPIGAWRPVFLLAVIPATLLGLGMAYLPDSPRWGAAQRADRSARLRDLLAPRVRRLLIVGMGLAVFQQITGINTVIYYAPTFLKSIGFNPSNAIIGSVIIGVVNVVMTVVAIAVIDRVGRRPLLIGGITGMVLSLGGLAVVTHFLNLTGVTGYVAVALLMIYVGSFAIGLGPVFWLLIAEIYPQRLRARAAATATVANWGSNFVVSITYLTLIGIVGQSWTFGLYGLLGLGALLFTLRLVPETRGRTLEDLERELMPQRRTESAARASRHAQHAA
ncbi:MAG TPA: MFS transporter [Candidatus Dormibacteraeota bacterium]|nr:MFS transporter [Candidatus Dormibacteraeota bacterium]